MRIDEESGVVKLIGAGRLAHVVAIGSWRAAYPVQLLSGSLWLRLRLGNNRDRAGRMSGLARARFGPGIAASRITAAWEEALEGRSLPPLEGRRPFVFDA